MQQPVHQAELRMQHEFPDDRHRDQRRHHRQEVDRAIPGAEASCRFRSAARRRARAPTADGHHDRDIGQRVAERDPEHAIGEHLLVVVKADPRESSGCRADSRSNDSAMHAERAARAAAGTSARRPAPPSPAPSRARFAPAAHAGVCRTACGLKLAVAARVSANGRLQHASAARSTATSMRLPGRRILDCGRAGSSRWSGSRSPVAAGPGLQPAPRSGESMPSTLTCTKLPSRDSRDALTRTATGGLLRQPPSSHRSRPHADRAARLPRPCVRRPSGRPSTPSRRRPRMMPGMTLILGLPMNSATRISGGFS